MTDRTFALGAGLLFVLSGAASAQSRPGVAFDQVIRTIRGNDSSTTIAHLIASGSDARMEMDSAPSGSPFAPVSMGKHAVIILREGGAQMFMLNTEKKEFISLRPIEMIQGAQKMMEGMGGSMVLDTSVSMLHVDSLGPGPTIEGHPTLRYRASMRMRLTISMMGEQQTVDTQSTYDVDATPDLTDFMGVVTTTSAFREMGESMGIGKAFFDKAVPAAHRMHGFPLHSVRQLTQSSSRGNGTSTEIIDVKNIRRMIVPDSAFVVPANYKAVTMPGMPPRGNE